MLPIDLKMKKERLIERLRFLYKKRGNRRPRTIDAQNDIGGSNYATYVRYFGSWDSALKEAGVDKDNN